MENQLKEQGAADKFDAVLEEIPRVREDLGFIPLVTPTSQIVGTQAVLNVLTGERYKSISKETAGILKGEYGAAPSAFNKELQERVLDGAKVITCRPADLLESELDKLTEEVKAAATDKGFKLADDIVDDVLTYALFPQIGLKFLENRGNKDAFEPMPSADDVKSSDGGKEVFTVEVSGQSYVVEVEKGGDITGMVAVNGAAPLTASSGAAPVGGGDPVAAPLAGNIFKVVVSVGQVIQEGDILLILEAMKMETEVRAAKAGTVGSINVAVGDSVSVGDTLLTL
jgi:oxaloacetate decarboxylase alpha subunit